MIELKELRAGYGTFEVLHGISIAFPPGQVTAIAGPNGCGKTTALKLVNGLLSPASGDILINGENIRKKAGTFSAAADVVRGLSADL